MGLLKTCIVGSILHGLGIMMIPAPTSLGWISLIIGLAAGVFIIGFMIAFLGLDAAGASRHPHQPCALIEMHI